MGKAITNVKIHHRRNPRLGIMRACCDFFHRFLSFIHGVAASFSTEDAPLLQHIHREQDIRIQANSTTFIARSLFTGPVVFVVDTLLSRRCLLCCAVLRSDHPAPCLRLFESQTPRSPSRLLPTQYAPGHVEWVLRNPGLRGPGKLTLWLAIGCFRAWG